MNKETSFLSPDDFATLCNVVQVLFHSTQGDRAQEQQWHCSVDCRDTEAGTHLRFTRWITAPTCSCEVNVVDSDETEATLNTIEWDDLTELDEDFDMEVLDTTKVDETEQTCCQMEYQHYRFEYMIALSPSYRVPVLYLFGVQTREPLSLDHGKPLVQLDQLLNVLGNQEPLPGLSLVDMSTMTRGHGGVCLYWMVHPCMTADALQDLLEALQTSTDKGAESSDYDLSRLDGLGDIRKVRYLARYFAVWTGLVGKHLGLDLPLSVARAIEQLYRVPGANLAYSE